MTKNLELLSLKYQKNLEYLYLKDDLNETECKLLYYILFLRPDYNYLNVEEYLGCDLNETVTLVEKLKRKRKVLLKDEEKFKKFCNSVLNIYGDLIGNLDLFSNVNIRENLQCNYTTLMERFASCGIILSDDDKMDLRRYCGCLPKIGLSKRSIEKDIYLTAFEYKRTTILKKVYIEHKEEFTDEQSFFIDAFVLSDDKSRQKVFKEKYPGASIWMMRQNLIIKAECIYYNITNMFNENFFDKESYVSAKEKFSASLTDEQKLLLDLYYGVDCTKMSVSQIAQHVNDDLSAVKEKIYSAINHLQNLYNGLVNSNEDTIDKQLYRRYITDKRYNLTDETREALSLFIIEELTYDEIEKRMNDGKNDKSKLSRRKITNLIYEGLLKLDYYRFGIIKPDMIDKNILANFFDSSHCDLTQQEKGIIIARKIEGESSEEIYQRFNINKRKLGCIIEKFNSTFLKFLIRNITINEDDIYKEISKEHFETVLTEREKTILSLFYGFKNKYNLEGIKYDEKEIASKLKCAKKTITLTINKSLDKIKARKAGIIKPELLYISREELDDVLKDKHLPISKEQRELICYLFGLNNYPILSLDELVVQKGRKIGRNHLKVSYQKAIVTIFKYLNNEIKGTYDFETEIKPNLRYFSRRDASFISDYYKEHLTYDQIAKKYNLKRDYVANRMRSLKNIISVIIRTGISTRFDFELYRELVDNNDLPFYGNLTIAKKCFELYTGEATFEHYTVPDIITELNLSWGETVVRRNIQSLVLSIYKLHNGIRKVATFNRADALSYFLENNSKMGSTEQARYQEYFETADDEIIQDEDIIFDLLKASDPEFCNLDTISREGIIEILDKYGDLLEPVTRDWLIITYNIDQKSSEHMSAVERALKLLQRLPEKA